MTHKYHAKPITVDGIRFASMAEARRYSELKMLEKAGEIEALELQPVFVLHAPLTTGTFAGAADADAGRWPVIGTYRADFAYSNSKGGRIVEDVKGMKTALYKWKKKHVEAQYGITVVEVTRR